jgi:hypothetical protein
MNSVRYKAYVVVNIDLIEEKKYYCRFCGREVSEEDCLLFDGLCQECVWEEEDDDLILGGGW